MLVFTFVGMTNGSCVLSKVSSPVVLVVIMFDCIVGVIDHNHLSDTIHLTGSYLFYCILYILYHLLYFHGFCF